MPMPALADAARIVADAAIYRVKKREAGNLVTSITLALALGLALRDVAHRLVFGLALNLFVYLVNDCFDVDVDTKAEGRDVARTRFLADHVGAGWLGVVLLGLVCAGIALAHGQGLLLVFGINVVVIIAYSRWLKRTPIGDLIAMASWGVSMALVGCPLDSKDGLRLVGLLGLLCVVTEGVQVIRDEATDRKAGVRTTAVALGVPVTAAITRVMIVAASLYTTLFLHRFLGAVLLLGVFPSLTTATAERSWDRLRALFGITWLAILAWLKIFGHLSPLLG
jgi:4-hydroxybenzoate polyprenyltransferase